MCKVEKLTLLGQSFGGFCILSYLSMHPASVLHTYTYIHAYMHTYTHACTHTCMHAYIHACIHTYMQVERALFTCGLAPVGCSAAEVLALA